MDGTESKKSFKWRYVGFGAALVLLGAGLGQFPHLGSAKVDSQCSNAFKIVDQIHDGELEINGNYQDMFVDVLDGRGYQPTLDEIYKLRNHWFEDEQDVYKAAKAACLGLKPPAPRPPSKSSNYKSNNHITVSSEEAIRFGTTVYAADGQYGVKVSDLQGRSMIDRANTELNLLDAGEADFKDEINSLYPIWLGNHPDHLDVPDLIEWPAHLSSYRVLAAGAVLYYGTKEQKANATAWGLTEDDFKRFTALGQE